MVDPVLIGGGVGGALALLVVVLLVRNAVKRGRAENEVDHRKEEEDEARAQLHEMSRGRSRGSRLLDRLQKRR